jgi:hypothetical protein
MLDRNSFRYIFRHKETNKISHFDTWCYGNIHDQINLYSNDLSKMCLVGISNATHEIIEVVWLHNRKAIWRKDNG